MKKKHTSLIVFLIILAILIAVPMAFYLYLSNSTLEIDDIYTIPQRATLSVNDRFRVNAAADTMDIRLNKSDTAYIMIDIMDLDEIRAGLEEYEITFDRFGLSVDDGYVSLELNARWKTFLPLPVRICFAPECEGKELELATKGAHPFLIKPNLREMEATLGIELRTMRAIRDAALLFIRLGVQHSVVSMGAMGAMYISADKTLFAPALRVETKSTVGAGDAMIGGMLLGYEIEKDMAKAFRYGIAAGAASVMTEGTQLIVRSDFDALLDQVRIQEV